MFKWTERLQFNSINNMLTNLFRSEVNIDQGIKEAVNSDQLFKPQWSLIFRGVEEMPAEQMIICEGERCVEQHLMKALSASSLSTGPILSPPLST